LFDGGNQNRFTDVGDAAAADRSRGADGTDAVDEDVGVADTSDEAEPVPTELIAEIL
jgi:hypothetical protein